MLQIIDITKQFGAKSAVKNVSLAFDGGFVAITGRSGSGKNTLLKMAGLLLKPTSGQILLDGNDVWAVSEKQRNVYRNSRLGFVFQDYSLEPNYTVAENVELPLLVGGMNRKERKARVDECLAFVGMDSMKKQRSSTLSGGEKQRVAVARAIANRPAFLFADEPCGNLDKENGDNIIKLFRSLARQGVNVIMVTHNEEDAKKPTVSCGFWTARWFPMNCVDLWALLFKRSLGLVWVCAVFAMLFAVVFFVGFVRLDMLAGLYDDIIKDAGAEYVSMECEYLSTLSSGDAEIGVYCSANGKTYDVTLLFGDDEFFVDRYNRGLNVLKVLSAWQDMVVGEPIAQSENSIWLFRDYANSCGISVGDSVTIFGDYVRSFRVAGVYTTELVRHLKTGFTPSFLVTCGEEKSSATLVCTVDQIYLLYKSPFGKNVTESDGIMDLCEGYYIAEVCFNALFWLFVVVAVFLQIKMINFLQKNLSVQSMLLSVFGMSVKKQWFYTFSILAVFGGIALGLSIGVFYVFVAVAESLASSIMNMVFGNIAIGGLVFGGFMVYLAVTALTLAFSVGKKSFEHEEM